MMSSPGPTRPRIGSNRRRKQKHGLWPGWLRFVASIGIVLLAFKVYAGWHWSHRLGQGPGVTFSPTKRYVGWRSTQALAMAWLYETLPRAGLTSVRGTMPWRLSYILAVVFPAAAFGVTAYVLLTCWRGRAAPGGPPRCRRCDYILSGLDRPQCPECGEWV